MGARFLMRLAREMDKPLPLVWLDVQDQFPAVLPVRGVTLDPSTMPMRATFRTVILDLR